MRDQTAPTGKESLIDTLIPGYGNLRVPALADVGGEQALFDDAGELDAYTSAIIACAFWSQLTDHAAVAEALGLALSDFDIDELLAFSDIALAAPHALPTLAPTLASAWRTISESDTTTRGNVALEAWTRLALGGWTNSLQLRGALDARCEHAARAAAEADIFLVRTVGAALDQWADDDLRRALEQLAGVEDVECDVAFELGMTGLREAVEAADPIEAAAHLDVANDLFGRATFEGGRPDAVAFMTACAAVAAFLRAQPVSPDAATAIHNAVGHWFLGYLNEPPHWRQARAQTGTAWAALVRDLQQIVGVDESAWLEPIKLLADIGRVYASHKSSTLLADPRRAPGELRLPSAPGDTLPLTTEDVAGVAVAIGPRLDAALAASAERVDLIDRWLSSVTEYLPDLPADAVDAITAARQRIREAPPPGKGDASRDAVLRDSIREALASVLSDREYARVEALLGPVDLLQLPLDAPEPSVEFAHRSLQEHLVLKRLNDRILAVLPDEHTLWSDPLNSVLTALTRVTAIAIDHTQGGERRLPWHGEVDAGRRPPEHRLADYIAQSIQLLTGIRIHVEVPNIGGGRADVVVPVRSEEFVIEVKRETVTRTNDELTAHYADQAAQYTDTRTPFAFLAVLDLSHHTARLSLDASFWVTPWTERTVTRALIGLRILADVASPSKLS